MTSVPKPLKFLRPHYGKLKEIYEGMAPGENKVRLLARKWTEFSMNRFPRERESVCVCIYIFIYLFI